MARIKLNHLSPKAQSQVSEKLKKTTNQPKTEKPNIKAKERQAKKRAELTAKFESAINYYLGEFVKEYQFNHYRKFRFDYCIPELMIAFEINGGEWMQAQGQKSRHNYGNGYIKDLEKINLAQLDGFQVFQFTYTQLEKADYLTVLEALKAKKNFKKFYPKN